MSPATEQTPNAHDTSWRMNLMHQHRNEHDTSWRMNLMHSPESVKRKVAHAQCRRFQIIADASTDTAALGARVPLGMHTRGAAILWAEFGTWATKIPIGNTRRQAQRSSLLLQSKGRAKLSRTLLHPSCTAAVCLRLAQATKANNC